MKTSLFFSFIVAGIFAIPIAFAQSVTGSVVFDLIILILFASFIFFIIVKILSKNQK